MGEKPILFNTQMVRAILNGSKTQTRRLIKRKYENSVLEMKTDKYGTRLIEIMKDEEGVTYGRREDGSTWRKIRPYIEPKPAYKRGDILYVRETWNYGYVDSDCKECCPPEYWFEEDDYKKQGSHPRFIINRFWYKADKDDEADMDGLGGRWRPSIHMPKEAARIWLRVTDVRLQRLQDISYDDVQAEGTDMDEWYEYDEWQHQTGDGLAADGISVKYETMRGFFGHKVWDATMQSLEQYEEYGWDANPWVWAYTFERIDNPREAKA